MKKLMVILLLTLCFFNIENIKAIEQQELKVMVIEINPTIKRIDNHPKVSDYFGQDIEATINEIKEDLEYTSHNYLKVNIVDYEYLDEYPKYNKQIELVNGSKAYQLDEETYLTKAGYDGSPRGNWYTLINSDIYDLIEAYSFDYDYIINKYDLIEKRKNGDFDQVWLVTIDPPQTYETIMVGPNPFWINAPGYVAFCPNFMIANISISRRDANLHALGHGVEGTLTSVFGSDFDTYNAYANRGTYRKYVPSYSSYDKDVISINPNNYNNLNYWEKFMLGTYSNKENYASVGNIHFPFNGKNDYDYSTTDKVYTNWKEWLNYPNIKGDFQLDNNNAWLENAGNNELGVGENKDPDRLYTRFWFYLMPHIEGYTKDGYLNNWWKYFTSLDFVVEIEPFEKITYNVKKDEEVKIKYVLKYNSGLEETKEINPQYLNVSINGDSIKVIDNKIVATKTGDSKVTIYHDNKKIEFNVLVNDEENKEMFEDKNENKTEDKVEEKEEGTTEENKKYSCEIVGTDYYDKEGNLVTQKEYEKECSNNEINPSTGYAVPIGSLLILMGIGIGIIYTLKKNNYQI